MGKSSAVKKKAVARAKPVKLPNVLSALVSLALLDLEAVERQKAKYTINMDVWHMPEDSAAKKSKCMVCLGGSVIAKSLRTAVNEEKEPDQFPSDVQSKLYALDDVRTGHISAAFNQLGIEEGDSSFPPDRYVVSYNSNPELFKAQLRGIVADLQARNL